MKYVVIKLTLTKMFYSMISNAVINNNDIEWIIYESLFYNNICWKIN